MRVGSVAAFLLGTMLYAAAVRSSAPSLQDFTIDAHVLVSGSSQGASNACFTLLSTTAEPVAGYSSGTDYAIAAGFLTRRERAPRDAIFVDSFEACTP